MTNDALFAQIGRQYQLIFAGKMILFIAAGFLIDALRQVFFDQHGALYHVLDFVFCLVVIASGIGCWIKGSLTLRKMQQSSPTESV